MTPEEQAVIDAADAWADSHCGVLRWSCNGQSNADSPNVRLWDAVQARRDAADRLAAPASSSIDTPDNRTGQT